MGRAPCCSKVGLHRGAWSNEEDKLLTEYIQTHGEGQWRSMPSKAGLLRCGKSCRLRWMNYLRPGIRRGNFTEDENDMIIRLHSIHGNRWSFIATELSGRTDNEVKNYWNSHLKRKLALDSGEKQVDGSKNNKKRKNKKKTDQKSRKVKIVEKPEETVPHSTSSSSSLPSSQSASLALSKNDMSSASSSSTTYQGEAHLLPTDTDFSWTNWAPLLEMEGTGARMDGQHDLDIQFDGFDLLMFKDEESNMLEKLYDECLHFLEDENGV
ncbi:unnamed protein product [Lactuca virosa]|uniref:Uncharacterized protein n=1 Tax=Lactuca virosa TaxID=75947 RepID=A0AAU9LIL0_9ASTR|nr:unnamed protein product [Lactuca virosa]